MLPKPFRLPSHRIPILLKNGKRMHSMLCSLIILQKKSDETSQFAVIIPHKLSKKAVLRNRTKRLLVETIHHQLPTLTNGFDVIVMAKKILATEKLQDVEPQLVLLLQKTKLLSEL